MKKYLNQLIIILFCGISFNAHAQTIVINYTTLNTAQTNTIATNIEFGNSIILTANLDNMNTTVAKSIDGKGFTLSGNNLYTGFLLNSGANLTIKDLTIQEIKRSGALAGVVRANAGSTFSTLGSVIFQNNTNAATTDGATVLLLGGNATFGKLSTDYVSFINNSAGKVAGALMTSTSSIGIFNAITSFTSNVAVTIGGAIHMASASTLIFNNSANFNLNIANAVGTASSATGGGAMYLTGVNTQATFFGTSTFSNNKAPSGRGGAIAMYLNSRLVIEETSLWTGNIAGQDGGAISSGITGTSGGSAIFKNNAIFGGDGSLGNEGNQSTGSGGAIYLETGGANFVFQKDVYFEGNTATNRGGAIGMLRSAYIEIQGNATFKNNTANNAGGALYLEETQAIPIGTVARIYFNNAGYLTTFSDNYGVLGAGAIFLLQKATLLSEGDMVFYSNTVGGGIGGAIRMTSSTVDLTRRPEATFNGSVMFGDKNDIIKGNYASSGGGLAIITGTAIFNDIAGFYYNRALIDDSSVVTNGMGGALMIKSGVPSTFISTASFNDSVEFIGNASLSNGGAIAILTAVVNATNSTFAYNTSGTKGGAIYMEGTSASLTSILNIYQTDTENAGIFKNNTQLNGISNAVYMAGFSSVNLFIDTNTEINLYDGLMALGTDNIFTVSNSGTLNIYGNINFSDSVSEIGTSDFTVNDATILLKESTIFEVRNLSLNSATLNTQGRTEYGASVIYNDFTIDSDSTLSLKVSQTEVDEINVKGNVSLDGNLNIQLAVGTYRNYRVALINSTNLISGQFATLNTTNPISTLDYTTDLTKVYLFIDGAVVSDLSSLSGLSYNQNQLATDLDEISLTATGDLSDIITEIQNLNNDDDKRLSLASISPYFISNIIEASLISNDKNTIYDRLKNDCQGYCIGNGIWAQIIGDSLILNEDENSIGKFKDNTYGVIMGADWQATNSNFIYGIYGKYENSQIEQNNNDADINGINLGFYSGYIKQHYEAKAVITAGYSQYNTTRSLEIPNILTRTASGSFNGTSGSADFEFALKAIVGQNLKFRPFAGIDASILNTSSFEESGANSLNLSYDAQNFYSSNARVGFGISSASLCQWKLGLNIAYIYVITGNQIEVKANIKDTNAIFNSRGSEYGKNLLGINGNIGYQLNSKTNIYGITSYKIGDNISDLYLGVGLKYKF